MLVVYFSFLFPSCSNLFFVSLTFVHKLCIIVGFVQQTQLVRDTLSLKFQVNIVFLFLWRQLDTLTIKHTKKANVTLRACLDDNDHQKKEQKKKKKQQNNNNNNIQSHTHTHIHTITHTHLCSNTVNAQNTKDDHTHNQYTSRKTNDQVNEHSSS